MATISTVQLAKAALAVVCPLVATGAFIGLGLPKLAPDALADARPGTYTEISVAVTAGREGVTEAEAQIAQATGDGAEAVSADPELSAAGQAWEDTWLASDDETVVAVMATVDRCTALADEAADLLDPALTLVGYPDQADDQSVPRVVTTADVTGVAAGLDECVDGLGGAVDGMGAALTQAKADASDAVATSANQERRTAVQATIDAANAALAGSEGKVTDDSVRQTLQAKINEAVAGLAIAAPPTGWEAIEEDTARLEPFAGAVADAAAAVAGAQAQWQAAEDARIAAEQAAAAAASRGSSYSGSSSSSGSRGSSSGGGGSSSGGYTGQKQDFSGSPCPAGYSKTWAGECIVSQEGNPNVTIH